MHNSFQVITNIDTKSLARILVLNIWIIEVHNLKQNFVASTKAESSLPLARCFNLHNVLFIIEWDDNLEFYPYGWLNGTDSDLVESKYHLCRAECDECPLKGDWRDLWFDKPRTTQHVWNEHIVYDDAIAMEFQDWLQLKPLKDEDQDVQLGILLKESVRVVLLRYTRTRSNWCKTEIHTRNGSEMLKWNLER